MKYIQYTDLSSGLQQYHKPGSGPMNFGSQEWVNTGSYQDGPDGFVRIYKVGPETPSGITTLAQRCHEDAKSLGWYDEGKTKSDIESLMLTVTELAEAVEELRKPYETEPVYYKPDSAKPEGYGVELADAIIRLLDLCAYKELDIGRIIDEKLAYNLTRGHRHGNKKY